MSIKIKYTEALAIIPQREYDRLREIEKWVYSPTAMVLSDFFNENQPIKAAAIEYCAAKGYDFIEHDVPGTEGKMYVQIRKKEL